jgi:molybdenum cofactor cytidylyltransferase
MGIPKLSLELVPGSSLGEIALSEMLDNSHIVSVSAVVKLSDSLKWVKKVERTAAGRAKLRMVPCEQAALGMSYSLREGLKDALAVSPQAIIVVLADQPFITSELLDSLITAYDGQPDLDYVACAGADMAMPPVLFAPSMFDALNELEGDAGARKLLASPAYRGKLVPVSSPQVFTDIDTPFELEEARSFWRGDKADETIPGYCGNAQHM